MSKIYCSECQKELMFPLVCMECQHLQESHNANFFEIFATPQKYQLNIEQLDENYEELTTFLHPDLYVNSSSKIKGLSRQYSILLNQAYTTLKDDLERAAYLLSLEFEKPLSDSILPPNFLLEMFDLQEQLANSKLSDTEQEAIHHQVQSKLKKLEKERYILFEPEHTDKSFDLLQQNINTTRYLVRFLEHQENKL